MNFQTAGVADLVRLNQKDEQFLERYNHALIEFLRLTTNNNLNKIRKYSSYLSQLTYFYLTSLSNIQTLGEEYTSLIRFQKFSHNIPSKTIQFLWLLLHTFGKDVFENILHKLEQKITEQKKLKPGAKNMLLNICKTLKNHQDLFLRFHLALFYLQKKYYNVSNRVSRIEYMCFVRNGQLSRPFDILGLVSLIYLISNVTYNLYKEYKMNTFTENISNNHVIGKTTKDCFLCAAEQMIAAALNCGHYFCWNCVFDLLNNSGVCPICRETIERNNIIMLENF